MSTYDPQAHVVTIEYDEHKTMDEFWHDGISVLVDGERIPYLTAASRMVFVHRGLGVVVKIGSDWCLSQCWDEFHAYHEVLDDEARTLVPTVFDFGVQAVHIPERERWGRMMPAMTAMYGYVVMEFVDGLLRGDLSSDYGTCTPTPENLRGHRHAMRQWKYHVEAILRRKYHLSDLHDGNLCWRPDGTIAVVDLGIPMDRTLNKCRQRSSYRSPDVQRKVSSLPTEAIKALELVP